MAKMSEKMVFLALQDNEDSRPIREAIEADNPHAVISQGGLKSKCNS
ncbi:MmoB/DmpM family protein [Caballeronia sp. M23-90]